MRIDNFLKSSYWFSQPRLAGGEAWWVAVGIFGGLAVAGAALLIIRYYVRETYLRTLLGRFSALGLTMGLLGLLWFWFRQESALWIGWRFWLVIWGAALVIWLARILWHLVKRIPKIKTEQREREQREKYLPRR